MSLIHNERIKLLATFINGLAVAVFAVGGLAPVFSNLYSTGPSPFVLVISTVCVLLAGTLHYVASSVLKRLRP